MSKSFRDRIQRMNEMYKLPIHETPHLFPDAEDRLLKFKRTLLDEVAEIDDIAEQIRRGTMPSMFKSRLQIFSATSSCIVAPRP